MANYLMGKKPQPGLHGNSCISEVSVEQRNNFSKKGFWNLVNTQKGVLKNYLFPERDWMQNPCKTGSNFGGLGGSLYRSNFGGKPRAGRIQV